MHPTTTSAGASTFARRPVRAPRGMTLSCKGWLQEAALRMLMNNLDPDVAELPEQLVVYGGSGKAARSWADFERIVAALRRLKNDETLLVQSGRAVGIRKTHPDAPRVLISNAMLVPKWATWDEFRRLEALGLTMYGQMTTGSWIYIGTQGILHGTYETFAACGRKHFAGSAGQFGGSVGVSLAEGALRGRRDRTAPRSRPSAVDAIRTAPVRKRPSPIGARPRFSSAPAGANDRSQGFQPLGRNPQ